MAETLSFAHISDPHLTSPAGVAPRDLLGEAVMTALLRDLTERDVDHVVVTGDLPNLGLPAELAEARRWLTRVGPPARLTVVPGNHDAYAASSTSRHPAPV